MSRSDLKSAAAVLGWLRRQVRALLDRARSIERAPGLPGRGKTGAEQEALLQVVVGRLSAIAELLDAASAGPPAPAPPHAPRIELADDLLSVPLGGIVDHAAVEALWSDLAGYVGGARVTLILDASATVSLEDAGAARLLEAWRALEDAGHGVIICGASVGVSAVLRSTGGPGPGPVLVDSFGEAVSLAFSRT